MKERRLLSIRAPIAASSPADMIRAAVERRTCVRATYNRNAIRLAPHALYTRHDELFVDGVVLERDGQVPRELKLGTFKLDGLHDLAWGAIRFSPEPVFDPASPRYAEDAVLVDLAA